MVEIYIYYDDRRQGEIMYNVGVGKRLKDNTSSWWN